MVRWAFAFMLCGCGRIGFDTSNDADLGPWSAPVAFDLAQDGDDPTGDQLEIYFNRNSADVMSATRANVTAPWTVPALVTDLESASNESSPRIAADGLSIYFASERPGGPGAHDIYYSSRAARGQPWSTPVLVSELASNRGDRPGCMTGDGLMMVIDSRRGGVLDNMYVVTRAVRSDPWSAPSELVELNTTAVDESGCLSADGLTVYFDSDRTGNFELYVAKRASRTSPFDPPVLIEELRSADDDIDPWIAPDQRTIVWYSNRGGAGQIWFGTR